MSARTLSLFSAVALSVIPQGHAVANSNGHLWESYAAAYYELNAPCTFPAKGEAGKYSRFLQRLHAAQEYVEKVFSEPKVSEMTEQHEEELQTVLCTSSGATFDTNSIAKKIRKLEDAVQAHRKNRDQ